MVNSLYIDSKKSSKLCPDWAKTAENLAFGPLGYQPKTYPQLWIIEWG
jgi:hypothetical protein